MKTTNSSQVTTTPRRMALPASGILLAAMLGTASVPANAQVSSEQKISAIEGGFAGPLDPFDLFGWSVAGIGDLNGDGVSDLVAGAEYDDDGGFNRGAVYILFMTPAGTVGSHQKISDTAGSFTGTLDDSDYFGTSVANLGDLDSDGVVDIAVGAYYDDDGGADQGAVWILFLNPDGTVKSHSKISETSGGFGGALDSVDWFGWALSNLGDLDGDGVIDLAVAADGDDDGGPPGSNRGAVWILFLNADGTVDSETKISVTTGGFVGGLMPSAYFGSALARLGDLDGDSVTELAVGADGDDIPMPDAGSMWILFLNPDGTVKTQRRIGMGDGGFTGTLDPMDQFGRSATAIGDLDGNGITELAVGADRDDDGGTDRGALWILMLAPDGSSPMSVKISATTGGFGGPLADGDHFGNSVTAVGDLDGNGTVDLAVGAEGSDDAGPEKGATWILFLGAPAPYTYCTAKVNSLGCTPAIGWSGIPSAAAGSGFTVSCTSVINNKPGLLFYGSSGQSAGAFQCGTLCVKAPIRRTPGQGSGGNPPPNDCSGAYGIDMNSFAVGALGGTPAAFLVAPGTVVNCQWWGRDPGYVAPCNTMLSDGLEYVVGS